MKELIFGTAGIPTSTKPRNTIEGIKQAKKLGLGAMEMEFVQSVNISEKKAPEVKQTAKDEGIIMTCHGQYFINLSSLEKEKQEASKKRILKAARIVDACGGWSATWHMGFYQKQPKDKVYDLVKKNLKEVLKTLKDEGNEVWIRPETTGKPTQWGDLQETLKLSTELEQVMPCVDYAHLHARTNGKENTLEEFRAQHTLIEKHLGKEGLKNMHIQVAGINYTEKGERNHLNLQDSDMNYKDLCKVWKEFKVKGVVIAESPSIEKDSLLLQKTYKAI